MGDAERIAEELDITKREKERIDRKYSELRALFLAALRAEGKTRAGRWRLLAVRRVRFGEGAARYLAERGFYEALRPVPEQVEKLYQGGQLQAADIQPYVQGVDVFYRVVAADETGPSSPPSED